MEEAQQQDYAGQAMGGLQVKLRDLEEKQRIQKIDYY